MKIDVLTIFPGMFEAVLGESIIKRAQRKKKARIAIYDLRDYTDDARRSVDDRPFGGGPGMVLKVAPIHRAVKHITGRYARGEKTKIVLLTPRGKSYNQKTAGRFSRLDRLLLICGRYEGIDERVSKSLVDSEISVGDYILTGGELPAMIVIDSVVRLIPGVLGDHRSKVSESFESNLLEYPQYTRPANYRKMQVPKVLLSGDHKKIAEWRAHEAFKRTSRFRPDLLTK